jgi:hypothetical protein
MQGPRDLDANLEFGAGEYQRAEKARCVHLFGYSAGTLGCETMAERLL